MNQNAPAAVEARLMTPKEIITLWKTDAAVSIMKTQTGRWCCYGKARSSKTSRRSSCSRKNGSRIDSKSLLERGERM